MPMSPLYRFGAFPTSDFTDVIQLWGFLSIAAGNTLNRTHVRAAEATAGYQVTSGKTLYLVRKRFLGQGGFRTAAFLWMKLGYADNDVGLDQTPGATTNPVMAVGLDTDTRTGFTMQVLGDKRGAIARGIKGGKPDRQWADTILWKWAIADKFPFIRSWGPASGDIDLFFWCVEI